MDMRIVKSLIFINLHKIAGWIQVLRIEGWLLFWVILLCCVIEGKVSFYP